MGERATVEVFEGEGKKFHLVVEPPAAISGIKEYLKSQTEEVSLFEPRVAGDLGVEMLNGKTIYDVLGSAAIVIAMRPAIMQS